MIIGAELFFDLFNQNQIKLIGNGLTLKETKFDWIVVGTKTKYTYFLIK